DTPPGRASRPARRAAGCAAPCAPAPGTWPGKRPPRRGGVAAPGGRRPGPGGRAAPPDGQTPPRRARRRNVPATPHRVGCRSPARRVHGDSAGPGPEVDFPSPRSSGEQEARRDGDRRSVRTSPAAVPTANEGPFQVYEEARPGRGSFFFNNDE